MLNFGFLLIMVDDAQEWGRKRILMLCMRKGKAVKFSIRFVISNEAKPTFEIIVSSSNKNAMNRTYREDFLKGIYVGYAIKQIGKHDGGVKYKIIAEEE